MTTDIPQAVVRHFGHTPTSRHKATIVSERLVDMPVRPGDTVQFSLPVVRVSGGVQVGQGQFIARRQVNDVLHIRRLVLTYDAQIDRIELVFGLE